MPTRTTTVRSPNSAAEVFAYLADYAHAAHWRPDILESRQVTSGPATRIGARFHIVHGPTRWPTDRVYEVVDVLDGQHLVLEAQTSAGPVTETLTVVDKKAGCVVRHRTHVPARGLRFLAAPVSQLVLRRRSLRAGDELRRLLAL